MSVYVFLNWFFCIGTTLLLGLIAWRYRFLIIKPSMIVIGFFHVQIQWAATIQSGVIEEYLSHPYPFLLLVQGFPFFGLLVSFFIMHKKTAKIYKRIIGNTFGTLEIKPRVLFSLFGSIVFLLLFYLSIVPLSRTGIYAILMDPLQSATARESALKLVENPFLRYGFALLKSALAPLLSVLIAVFFIQKIQQKKFLQGLGAFFVFLFTLIAVMLPGARMPGGILLLTIILAIFTLKRMPIRPLYILISFLLIMVLPIFMTLFREGQDINLFMFFDYLKGGIFERVFLVPMETGLWHVHYGQEVGFVGAAGIPKLAEIVGVDPINLGNLIYLEYSPYHVFSGLANTCFVFAYYTCFGIGSLILSLLGLWALDLAFLVFDKIRNNAILLAAVAATATSSFWLVSTMYTTALITNGFIFILIIAIILDRLSDFRLVS